MPTKYLVTGLPRSRTAWMAAFLGCPHEPTGQMNEFSEVYNFFENNQGCSDSTMGWWLDDILESVGPRVLIIDRPIDDVERSLVAAFPNFPRTSYCRELKEKLDQCRKHWLVMSVPYSRLRDIATMRKVFWHLRSGEPFDEGRYKQMNTQRIVVDVNNLNLTGKLLPTYFSKKVFARE